jgi:hypothetical protein
VVDAGLSDLIPRFAEIAWRCPHIQGSKVMPSHGSLNHKTVLIFVQKNNHVEDFEFNSYRGFVSTGIFCPG